MVNKDLVEFIKEARRRGFDDYQIRTPLLARGWPVGEVEIAFDYLKPKPENRSKITLYLNPKVLKMVEQRAKKNLFSISEQIEDILRRSTINIRRKTPKEEKVDDKFITFFSRKGRKK